MKVNILQNRKYNALWILVHGLVFLLMTVLFLCGTKFKINTNLFDILPETNARGEVSKADSVLNNKTGRTFVVLVKSDSFENSKKAASNLCSWLEGSLELTKEKKSFESISLYMNENVLSEIENYYSENKFFLLNGERTERFLIEGDEGKTAVEDFITESQMLLMSPFSFNADYENDPFGLAGIEITESLDKINDSGTSMSLKDGVLAAEKDGFYYVMIRGVLTPEGASITNKNSGVKKIYDAAKEVQKNGIEFIFSGVPFHSYESSTSAQFEITLISTVSMILIILLCIYIFRNALPVVSSVGAITMSALFALSSVLVVFREIHILTFVFGTTLIGTCLDYSVHFFVRWKGDLSLKSGTEIRNHLFKGLSLSLVSTEICYLVLVFAPFTLLKQVAVFSFSGILSSYLTVLCLYPEIKMPKEKKELAVINWIKKIQPDGKVKKIILASIAVLSLITFFAFRKNVRIENNLRSFYSMKGRLLQSEIESNKILNPGSKGCYFIVRGSTEEEVFANEAAFLRKLEGSGFLDYTDKTGTNATYNCVTKYIPAMEEQERSYRSCEKLNGYLSEQYETIGFSKDEINAYEKNYLEIFNGKKDKYVSIENCPDFIKDAVKNFWIGKIGENYYSMIMPMHFDDVEFLRKMTAGEENVFFMNKMADIGSELNRLTKLMLLLLAAAVVIMFVVLKCFYKWSDVFKIIVIPLITVFVCVSILAMANIPLGFFSVTGIILVFGLSIDYIIYAVENSTEINSLAIILSFVSSALSFGALALSSFMPVFMFGLPVFTGLTTAVICTQLIKNA